MHTFITVIESKGLRTNNSYYDVINRAWTMIAKHSAISPEELLSFRTFRVSIGYNDGVSPVPRISYIMKCSFMKEKLLLEKNKNVIIAGNMDAILTAFSRAIAELEEDHLNILEENSIPMKAKKEKKTEEWRKTLYVNKMEIKQITHSILSLLFPFDIYNIQNEYGYTMFARVIGKQKQLKTLESIIIYLWEKKKLLLILVWRIQISVLVTSWEGVITVIRSQTMCPKII